MKENKYSIPSLFHEICNFFEPFIVINSFIFLLEILSQLPFNNNKESKEKINEFFTIK